jgi:hypothetical protein
MLILVLILSTRLLIVAVEGFRVVDPLPSSSSLLQHRRQQQRDHAWHRRRRPRPGHARDNSFDLVPRGREEQQQIQRFSKLLASSTGEAEREGEDDDDEFMGAAGEDSRGLGLDPAALFSLGRGPRGASSAAAAAHERSRQNRNQILGLLSDPAAAASRSLDAAFTARVDSSVGADNNNEGEDDEDDGLSVVLDADEYVQASNSNDKDARNEMLVAITDDDNDNAGWPMDDATATNEWAVNLDPAYRAVLETLVNVPNSNPTNRDTVRSEQQGGLSSSMDGGAKDATIDDLVRILEAQQSASMSDLPSAAIFQPSMAAATASNESAAEQIHHLVFENEDGFWNQSDAFRKGLTDPANRGAARQVLADRRSALFEERNRASLHKLEDRLDQLQRSIDVPASDPKGALANRCPRCRSVLTDHDVELMRRRDTRLCPVCTAEVRLVSKNPTGSTTTTTTATFASRVSFRTNVVAPSSALRDSRLTGNRRVYRTSREQRPPPTFAKGTYPPEQRRPLGDSEAPPSPPTPPSEPSYSS